MTPSTPEFLSNPALELLIFGGKGGVGKTTCATSTALHLARSRPTSRVLLLSTDPAHSVADCLDGAAAPENLCVIELSAEQEHRAFMAAHAQHLRAIASRGTFLDGPDVDRFIELSIPGVDELMAFLRVARWVEEEAFDTIVVDTAPSGHTLRLLAMSDLLATWLAALDALLAKHRYMSKLFGGRRVAPRDDADEFLEQLRGQIESLGELLTDGDRCRFVPVMLAEPLSVAETVDVLGQLESMGVAAPDVVLNRLVSPDERGALASQRALQARVLSTLPRELASRRLWCAMLAEDEPTGVGRLAVFTRGLRPLDRAALAGPVDRSAADAATAPAARCQGAATLPAFASGTGLIFFAGKGGTGKTTLSAATAVRLASQGRRTLIVSTDPAHSLGDCVDVELADAPARLMDNLDAMEIDATAEFESLREQYRTEIEEALDAMFQSVDASFDREAMERLIDLAPPGLDECMALLRIIDQLDGKGLGGRYDAIVVDTAPTGHLLRLLELPELIEAWLGHLFSLFLKYDRIFRLPRLQARLVEISRGIKKLRAVLADRARCSVQIVSILTSMAFRECQDLHAALERLGVGVGNLFLNLATLEDASPLAAAVRRREDGVRAQYASAFAAVNQLIVYRVGEPRGLAGLRPLADAIYDRRSPRANAA